MNIGFIGLGAMGKPMAQNLIHAGYSLRVYDLVPEAVRMLAECGAQGAQSACDAAAGAGIVITMLPDGAQVKNVVLGENGILHHMARGALLVDMSSISPADSVEIAEVLKEKGLIPKLVIVRVGANPSDLSYERGALKRCESIGIAAEVLELPEDISQNNFIAELEGLNKREDVHGILIFRPLPKQLDENVIKYVISPEKDMDCFSPVNVAKIMENDETGFAPCTPSAVMEILKYYNVPLKGKKAAVIGRSMVVGKPVSMLLLNENATVTICHSKTQDMPSVCSEADILVVGIGRAKMIDSKYVKDDAVVIDEWRAKSRLCCLSTISRYSY
jgi:methylenetetrahydrofolate dehydrogenase (NADP+)/methenyltetrahydrofolate cyclohydrolase